MLKYKKVASAGTKPARRAARWRIKLAALFLGWRLSRQPPTQAMKEENMAKLQRLIQPDIDVTRKGHAAKAGMYDLDDLVSASMAGAGALV